MSIESLRTISFRNLDDAEVNTSAADIYLVGENGQGKSNFLEAVYFCSYASSFRSCRETDVIQTGKNGCSVSAYLKDSQPNSIAVKYVDGKKGVFLDEKRIEDRKVVLDVLSPIVFCHEDLDFISGPPERKRWFFDQAISIYNYIYIDDIRKYRRILKTRNAVLKDNDYALLDIIDEQLALAGHEIMMTRATEASFFSSVFEKLFEQVSDISGVAVQYSPSWKTTDFDSHLRHLHEKRSVDLQFGVTTTGPHRDRYIFIRDGHDFSMKASTGQRRLLSLLLRVTQAVRYLEKTRTPPVLLLDDVLLELDPAKRKRFLDSLPAYEQAFFTFLPEEPYKRYQKKETLVYHVERGCIKK